MDIKKVAKDIPFRGTMAEVLAWAVLFFCAIGKIAIGRDTLLFFIVAIITGPIAGMRFLAWRKKKGVTRER